MKIYGKIHQILKRERIISIVINSKLEYFHMTNRFMKDFKIYLFVKNCILYFSQLFYAALNLVHENLCRFE